MTDAGIERAEKFLEQQKAKVRDGRERIRVDTDCETCQREVRVRCGCIYKP